MRERRNQHIPGKSSKFQRNRNTFSSGKKFSSSFSGGSQGFKPQDFKPEVVLTRRNLLIGAAGIAGVAAVGGIGSAAIDMLSPEEQTITSISVPQEAVTGLDTLNEVSYNDHFYLAGNFYLPYGTLVWADNDVVAACLTPGEDASPLNKISLLYLSTGSNPTVLSQARGADEGYEIFDVRCSTEGAIWVECNMFENKWRVYTASLDNAQLSGTIQVDEGDSNWLTPSLAAVGNYAFWQVIPRTGSEAAKSDSALKAVAFGSDQVQVPYTSKRPFATRVTPTTDGVVIAPRADSSSVYYSLTKISASDLSTVDQMTLPSAMTPQSASYGKSGFAFTFENIYNYGGGISNLGTYTPMAAVTPYQYDNLAWFRFGRTPSATPCWCGEWFAVKSTRAISGVHFGTKSFFVIDIVSNTDSYGEYLVSTGNSKYLVGLNQVRGIGEEAENYAQVRVFAPRDGSIGSAFEMVAQ